MSHVVKKPSECEVPTRRGLDSPFYSPKVVLEIAKIFFSYLDRHKIWGPLLVILCAGLLLIFCLLWRSNDVVIIIEALKS